jgi:hypothetical protein
LVGFAVGCSGFQRVHLSFNEAGWALETLTKIRKVMKKGEIDFTMTSM